MRYNVYMPVGK